jgi:trimeric autotransporter adhesin
VAFRADGGAGACATTGAALTHTGPIAAGSNRLVCAEVTVPVTTSGNAAPGTYPIDFVAASATNPAVNDVKRDAVIVNALRRVVLSPDNAQQTIAGAAVTYAHTLSNRGNVSEAVSFAAGCLVQGGAARGWTSAAWIDTNPAGGNGVLEPGLDTLIVCGTTTDTLAAGQSRAIWVRVVAPAAATTAEPADVTTLSATYLAGSRTISATDTTTIIDGLLVLKEQRSVACDGSLAGAYTTANIATGPATAPGSCIGYRVTATNAAAIAIGSVVVADTVPANTRMFYACGAPSTSVGAMDSGSAPESAGPPAFVQANVGTLAPAQAVVVTFCVQVDPP